MGLKGCRQDQKFRELTVLCRAPRVSIFRRARFRARPSGRPIGCGFIGFTLKSIGLTSSAVSAAFCAKVAPSRINWLRPRERGSGERDTAIASRPASAPHIVGQLLLLPMRGSVPLIKFSIFTRCFQKMINEHATSIATRSYRSK